jgi:Fur family transcriptional regulator, ferric uptake regulator
VTQREIRKRLKGSGFKATPQRMAILAAVEEMASQFTPRQLLAKLRSKHPDIGLVTIYRTLKLLADSGLVCRMERSGAAQTYARSPSEHHHHLVCTSCNRVVDVESCGLRELEDKLAAETGFTILDHHVEFEGLCRECQEVAP